MRAYFTVCRQRARRGEHYSNVNQRRGDRGKKKRDGERHRVGFAGGKISAEGHCKVRVRAESRRGKRSFGGEFVDGIFYENRGVGEEKHKRRKRFGERNYRERTARYARKTAH